jgi:hypothetical protein
MRPDDQGLDTSNLSLCSLLGLGRAGISLISNSTDRGGTLNPATDCRLQTHLNDSVIVTRRGSLNLRELKILTGMACLCKQYGSHFRGHDGGDMRRGLRVAECEVEV